MASKGVVRSLKNFTKGFSDIQIKVREATSNDAWGPSGTLMNEIAQSTNNQRDFIEVMDMIDKRLNDKGKNWRHVFKALLLLDYCLHVGSENVVLYAKENAYVVKTLKEFQHVEENGKDVGANVRQKAKDITNLLQDDNRLREERRQRQKMRDRMAGVGDYIGEMAGIQGGGTAVSHNNLYATDDDRELEKALMESKRQGAEEDRKRRQGEEEDLAMALKLSQQEAKEKEQQSRDQSTSGTNFDALFNPYNQPSHQTTWIEGKDRLSDTNNNQTYETLNNPYLQPFHQPQIQHTQLDSTTSNLFGISQQQHQANFGNSAFLSDTYHQQIVPIDSSSSQPNIPTGPRNPFSQTLSQQQQQQAPLPNTVNAFTTFGQTSSSLPPFNSSTVFEPSSFITSIAGQSQSFTTKSNNDPRYQKLDSLLGSRDDGMDTFGNTGPLRVPSGTGFANTIQTQGNVDAGCVGNLTERTGTGHRFDGMFDLSSSTTSQQQHQSQSLQHSGNRNPFIPTSSNSFVSTQPSPFN